MSSIAYFILSRSLIKYHGRKSTLAIAVGNDFKGKISTALYVVAIIVSFLSAWVSLGIYATVALIWLVPDRRIEKVIT